jgi:hypothetical protein
MNLINNPPTTNDLKSLYESKLYKGMLVEFEKISGHKLRNEDEDEKYIYARLDNIKRRYLILNIPFKEVLFEFEKEKDNLIRFTDLSVRLFSKEKDKGGEFPEGEGLSKDDEPETIKVLGITRLFYWINFANYIY